jgi:phage terminase Nu1 subunit (DNA packaging protein)
MGGEISNEGRKDLQEIIQQLAELADAADWYRRCLQDVLDGRVVRGLDESKAEFESALADLQKETR